MLGLIITVIATFFFLVDGPQMTKTVMRLSPLDDQYEIELLEEFDRMSRAVVLATLLSAVVQGALGGFGYWLVGLDSVFLLMLLTTVMAMVPVVGTASIWVPVSLWLYLIEGRPGAAIFLAIYGTAIISGADNVIKPYVLHGQSKLHPLLALLSVLGGVQALGPIGILVGPMVVVFLQTLLKILHRELTSLEQSGRAASEASG
jgi:predicted PurR-regulated permease PerM